MSPELSKHLNDGPLTGDVEANLSWASEAIVMATRQSNEDIQLKVLVRKILAATFSYGIDKCLKVVADGVANRESILQITERINNLMEDMKKLSGSTL